MKLYTLEYFFKTCFYNFINFIRFKSMDFTFVFYAHSCTFTMTKRTSMLHFYLFSNVRISLKTDSEVIGNTHSTDRYDTDVLQVALFVHCNARGRTTHIDN